MSAPLETASYHEWIPVRERVPDADGDYATLIKPLLEDEPFERVQRYTKQAHPAISGFRYMPVTHWRPLGG